MTTQPLLFLVGHPDDATASEELRARLEAEGFELWSRGELLPGDLVVEEREKALRSCAGGVVLISAKTLHAWEAESLQVLVCRAVQLECFVVPVLTGANVSLPPYLSTREPGRLDELDAVVQGIRKRLNGVHEEPLLPAPGPRLHTNIRGRFLFVGRTAAIAELEIWFEDTSRSAAGVIYGPPGTGRTGLAEWWGVTHLHQYPGGVFRVRAATSPYDGLVRVTQQVFELRAEDFRQRGPHSVYEPFAREPTLLILDNLESEAALQIEGEPLLPFVDQPIHVLATSTAIDWSPQFRRMRLGPLARPEALTLLQELDDPPTLDETARDQIVAGCGGYPAVLVPVVMSARRSVQVGRPFQPSGVHKKAQEAAGGLYQPLWAGLDEATRAVLCAAACQRSEGIAEDLLQELSGAADDDQFEKALVTCLEIRLLEQESPTGERPQSFRMFSLLHEFVRAQAACGQIAARGLELRVDFASRIDRRPAPEDAARLVALLPETPEGLDTELLVAGGRAFQALGLFEEALRWSRARPGTLGVAWADCCEVEIDCLIGLGRFKRAEHTARELSHVLDGGADWVVAERRGRCLHNHAVGLAEQGKYTEALRRYEEAASVKRLGDIRGRVDHNSVGSSVHGVGYCLSSQGMYAEALPRYEQAALEMGLGDIHGRVDHESVGSSVHQVGYCLSFQGKHAEALPRYEEAALEMRLGDIHGRVDHESVGSSVHQEGYCLSEQGEYAKALPKFEEAALEGQQGDVHGRVDHNSVGLSMHQEGYCLSSQGKYAEALPRYEEAALEMRLGDIHGRVDHGSVGSSVHQVGYCLSEQGEYAEALPHFEEAVSERRQGDIHGCVNQNRVGSSIHQVGYCLSKQGKYAEGLPLFEEAAAKMRQGNIHGRVDHDNVSKSVYRVGYCLREQGKYAEALLKFEEAVLETRQGDIHGRVDHDGVGKSVYQVGYCLSKQGKYAEALLKFEEAALERRLGDIHGRVDHDGVGKSVYQVGYCLSKQGKYAEALPKFEEAASERRQGDIHGREDSPGLARSQEGVADTLDQLGRIEEAAEWRAKAQASRARGTGK